MIIKKYLFVFAMSLLLVGCSSNNFEADFTSLNEKLTKMKEEITKSNTRIKDLESNIASKNQQYIKLQEELNFFQKETRQLLDEIETNTYMNRHLLHYLPEISHKHAFIKEIIKEENSIYFILDYVSWGEISGISNEIEERDKVKVNKEVAIYKSPFFPSYTSLSQFTELVDGSPYATLFYFAFINNEIILVVEQN